jgi:surface protein
MRPRVPPCVRVRVWGWPHTYPRRNVRAFSVGVDRVWLGSQAFSGATAFNANIGAWNVLRVTTYTSAFDSVGLADCIKRGVYDNWGSTLQAAYPTWSSLSSVCAITDANFKTAATAWLTDPVMATKTYGPIADWNTAPVTSMDKLFSAAMTFNADISKWNVASVSNMDQV